MRWHWKNAPLREAAALAIAGLLALTLVAAQTTELDDYRVAANTILCDCGCHPQSVHECACGRAAEMRNEIRAFIADGMTGEQIIDHYVSIHGEQIRIAPTADGFNLIAWLGPLFGLGAATLILFRVVRRWTRERPVTGGGPEGDVEAPPVLDEAYRRRLQEALEKME